MLEKPKILSDKEINKHNRYSESVIEEDDWDIKALLQTQRDACWKKAVGQMVQWIYDRSIAIGDTQCETHGRGRFIPENNWQALQSQLEAIKGG